MVYSEELKNSIVSRILSKELSIQDAIKQYHISRQTLCKWKKQAVLDKIIAETGLGVTKDLKTEKLSLPRNISYLQAHEAVSAMKLLSDIEFGKYCREQGITTNDVSVWKEWFEKHPDAVCTDEVIVCKNYIRELEAKHKEALIDANEGKEALTTLGKILLLSKKASAIFGTAES